MPDSFWPQTHDTRADLLRQAYVKLHHAGDCKRHRMAVDLAQEAGELLRRAGLYDLAADCDDEFGCDTTALLRELDKEMSR